MAIEEGTFDYTYSGSNNINEVAWYYENSGGNKGATQDVGLRNLINQDYMIVVEIFGNGVMIQLKIQKMGKSYTYKAFDSSNVYRRLKGGSWYGC